MTSAQAKVSPRHPDPEVVRKAEAIFAKLGITPEEAVNILYKQTVLHGAFPISDLVPNEDTQDAVSKARAGTDVAEYGSVDEIMAEFKDAQANPNDEI